MASKILKPMAHKISNILQPLARKIWIFILKATWHIPHYLIQISIIQQKLQGMPNGKIKHSLKKQSKY